MDDVSVVRSILKQNEYLLRRHLVLSPTVLDKMRANGLITDVTRRKIQGAPADRQVIILITSLESRGLVSLRKFLEVLRDTGHSWMIEPILDTDVTAQPRRIVVEEPRTEYQRQVDDVVNSYTRPGPYSLLSPQKKTVMFDPSSFRHNTSPGWSTCSNGVGLSLSDVLKAREHKEEPQDPLFAPRGVIHARSLLADPTVLVRQRPTTIPGITSHYHLPGIPPLVDSKDEIPMTLYNLNEAMAEQDNQNQQAMSVLQQEAVAIRQLLDQNARDQGNVRRKQAAVSDIVGRLRDIHYRAKDVYQPAPHPNIGRYRLAQLNQIPWSIDK